MTIEENLASSDMDNWVLLSGVLPTRGADGWYLSNTYVMQRIGAYAIPDGTWYAAIQIRLQQYSDYLSSYFSFEINGHEYKIGIILGVNGQTATINAYYDGTAFTGVTVYVNTLHYFWVGFRLEADGTVTPFHTNTTASEVSFSSSSRIYESTTRTWSGAFTEAIKLAVSDPVNNAYDAFSTFYLDYTNPPIAGGSAVFSSILSTNVINAMGAGGGATIETRYESESEIANNHKKSVELYDTLGNLQFRGEIREAIPSWNTVIYKAVQKSKLLSKQLTGISPIIASGTTLAVDEDTLYDDGSDLFSGLTLNGNFIVFTDTDTNITYSLPHTAVISDSGAIENSSIHNMRGIEDPYSVFLDGLSFYIEFTYYVYVKTGSVIDSIALEVDLSTVQRTFADLTDYPTLYLYNYTNAAYDCIKDFSSKDGSSESNWFYTNTGEPDAAPRVQDTYYSGGCSSTAYSANHYMNEVVSIGDYTQYEVKVKYNAGIATVLGKQKVEFYLLRIKVHSNNIQTVGLGIYKIDTNTTNSITIDNSYGSQLPEMPQSDGITSTDTFVIVQNVDNYLSDLFTNSTFTLSHNLTNSRGITLDTTDISTLQILQMLEILYNARFWHIASTTTDYLYLKTSFVSSGITIEASDIVNINETFQQSIDTNDLLDAFTVKGSNLTQRYEQGVDYTYEYSQTLGEQQMLFVNQDIDTALELENYANYIINQHSKVKVLISFQINWTGALSTLQIGQTVALQLPSTANPSRMDYSGSDELLITSLAFNNEGDEIVTITLERIL